MAVRGTEAPPHSTVGGKAGFGGFRGFWRHGTQCTYLVVFALFTGVQIRAEMVRKWRRTGPKWQHTATNKQTGDGMVVLDGCAGCGSGDMDTTGGTRPCADDRNLQRTWLWWETAPWGNPSHRPCCLFF